jgi:hypothetical protein
MHHLSGPLPVRRSHPTTISSSYEPQSRGNSETYVKVQTSVSEAASFLDQTTSFETEVQEREPWDFYEWITCNEKPRCAPNICPIMFWRET